MVDPAIHLAQVFFVRAPNKVRKSGGEFRWFSMEEVGPCPFGRGSEGAGEGSQLPLYPWSSRAIRQSFARRPPAQRSPGPSRTPREQCSRASRSHLPATL